MTVQLVRPVSTYTLAVDQGHEVIRYEWSVTGPENAECYAPAQFKWSTSTPVAVWDHPHDPATGLPCQPHVDHSASVVTVRVFLADSSSLVCSHQGAEATAPGAADECVTA
jgi:hypothetical protein